MRTGITAFAAALMVCAWGMGQPANAAKEQFQRTKPHVNVGTIHRDDRPDDHSQEEPRLEQGGDAPSSAAGERRYEPLKFLKRIDKE